LSHWATLAVTRDDYSDWSAGRGGARFDEINYAEIASNGPSQRKRRARKTLMDKAFKVIRLQAENGAIV
jgi:hypothetical protein